MPKKIRKTTPPATPKARGRKIKIRAGLPVLLGEFWRQLAGRQFVLLVMAVWLWGISSQRNGFYGLLVAVGVVLVGSVILEYSLKRIYRRIKLAGQANYTLRNEAGLVSAAALKLGDELFLRTGEISPAELEILESHQLNWQEAGEQGSFSSSNKRILPAGSLILSGQLWGKVQKLPAANRKNFWQDYAQTQFKNPYQWPINLIAILLLLSLLLLGEGSRLWVSLGTVLALGGILGANFFPGRLSLWKAYRLWRKAGLNPPAWAGLGQVQQIAFNLNETVTEPLLQAKEALIGRNRIRFSGQGFSPQGELQREKRSEAEVLFFKAAALCNNAQLLKGEIPIGGHFRYWQDWQISGEVLEGALLVMAARAGVWREILEKQEKRLLEMPFTGFRRRMSVLYQNEQQENWLYAKGAVSNILASCSYYLSEYQPFTSAQKQSWQEQAWKWNQEGYRVLALAAKKVPELVEEDNWIELESDLIFLGLVALEAELQPEAVKSIRKLKAAGIKPLILSGESRELVETWAISLGLGKSNAQILTGQEIAQYPERMLRQKLRYCELVAEADPAQKAKVMELLPPESGACWLVGAGVSEVLAGAKSGFVFSSDSTAANFLKWPEILTLAQKLQSLKQKTEQISSFRLTGLLSLWVLTLLSGVGAELLEAWHLLILGLAWGLTSCWAVFTAAPDSERFRFSFKQQKELFPLLFLGVMTGVLLWAGQEVGRSDLLFQGILGGGAWLAFFYFGLFRLGGLGGIYWLLLQISLSLVPFWQSLLQLQPLPLKYWLLIYGLAFLPFAFKELVVLLKRAFWRKITYFKI